MVLGCGPYHIGASAFFYSSGWSCHLKTFPITDSMTLKKSAFSIFFLLFPLHLSIVCTIRQQCGVWLVCRLQHQSFETNGQEDGGGQPQPWDGQHRLRRVRPPLLWGTDAGTHPGYQPPGGQHVEVVCVCVCMWAVVISVQHSLLTRCTSFVTSLWFHQGLSDGGSSFDSSFQHCQCCFCPWKLIHQKDF